MSSSPPGAVAGIVAEVVVALSCGCFSALAAAAWRRRSAWRLRCRLFNGSIDRRQKGAPAFKCPQKGPLVRGARVVLNNTRVRLTHTVVLTG